MGFSTINIPVPKSLKSKSWGIYFSLVKIGEKIYPGVTHLGPVKTFSLRPPTCETHLLTVKSNLYNKTVEKKLIFRFREVERFPSIRQLKKQIKKDIQMARRYFGI